MEACKDLRLTNCKILTPFEMLEEGSITITEGKIAEVNRGISEESGSLKTLDMRGALVIPGFVDLHCHGALGEDFMSASEEAVQKAAWFHLQHGTTSLLPTSLSAPLPAILSMLKTMQSAMQNGTVPNLAGVHIEGPYLSELQCGAQDTRYLKNPDPEEYYKILEFSSIIRRWTIACELPGALELGRILARLGILPSIGHSNAQYSEVVEAVSSGFRLVTHLYSGTSLVTRKRGIRYPGVVESTLLLDTLAAEIIVDGMHLPEALVQLVFKIKGADNVIMVTDAMAAAGMGDGIYRLGDAESGQDVSVHDGVAWTSSGEAFAGSIATADHLLRKAVLWAGISLKDAVTSLSATPAKLAGIYKRTGSIEPGKDADILILDDNLEILMVIAKGRIVGSGGSYGSISSSF